MSPQAGGAPAKPDFTVAEVLRVGLPSHVQGHSMPPHHWRVLRAIMACRTPALGGHMYQCGRCATPQFVPHSCRNRHCPSCQGANGFAWLKAQESLLLPIPYFHVVFTLPHALNPLIRQNPGSCYDLLFASASTTLLSFGEHELGAQLGLTMVLHTWSQTLLDHYHVHCIVTGGGLRTDGSGWAGTPAHLLFPVRALSAMFRGKFRAGLQGLYERGELGFHGQLAKLAPAAAFQGMIREATAKPWVVYAKRPFAGPETVLAYLARYTHRIGLTNYRIRALNRTEKTVTFAYRDYADHSRKKTLRLSCDEFIRRLRLHILPERFVKIRHYGLLSNRNRHSHIEAARAALPQAPLHRPPPTLPATAAPEPEFSIGLPRLCPHCHQQADWILVCIQHPPTHGPARTVPYLDSS